MEGMLGCAMLPVISLSRFLAEYKQTLTEEALPFEENKEILHAMEEKCSLNKLSTDTDAYISDYLPGFSEQNRKIPMVYSSKALELKTVQYIKQRKSQSVKNPFKRTRDIFKYVRDLDNDLDTEYNNHYNDLLIWVRVYRPARVTHVGRSLERPVFAEEFVCLGSNYLTELRDKIYCICNGKRFFDISNNPEQPMIPKETDPGYFFITDTFYSDMRNVKNVDYATHIRNWARTAVGLNHLQFKVAKMEETKFIDLNVSLGFPQLYQHHGNCEHVFTISQVEILSPGTKCWPIAQYPRLITFNLYNDRACHMCGRVQFIFVVTESNRQLHDPAYLCEKCFVRYHYVDGKKVGDFKAYRLKDKIENDLVTDEIVDDVVGSNQQTETEKQIEIVEIDKVVELVEEPRTYNIIVRKNVRSKEQEDQEFLTDVDEEFIVQFLDDDL